MIPTFFCSFPFRKAALTDGISVVVEVLVWSSDRVIAGLSSRISLWEFQALVTEYYLWTFISFSKTVLIMADCEDRLYSCNKITKAASK